MGRKPNVEPIARLSLKLPLSARGWLEQELWSEVEQRVPTGAYQAWVLARIEEQKVWGELELGAYGFPPEYFIRGPKWMLFDIAQKLGELQQKGVEKDVHG